MACIYCGMNGEHHYRCPLYESPKASHYCSICQEGIYDGEEYIVNEDDEYAHYRYSPFWSRAIVHLSSLLCPFL